VTAIRECDRESVPKDLSRVSVRVSSVFV